jgi:hypothetical protein
MPETNGQLRIHPKGESPRGAKRLSISPLPSAFFAPLRISTINTQQYAPTALSLSPSRHSPFTIFNISAPMAFHPMNADWRA